jgi:hypothetical protein
MNDEPIKRDPELDAVEAKILRERDELLAERSRLMQARQELLSRLRHADRRLADCRATARFFGLKIDFPEEEAEQIDRIERDRAQRERAIRVAERDMELRRAESGRLEQEKIRAQREFLFNTNRPVPSIPPIKPQLNAIPSMRRPIGETMGSTSIPDGSSTGSITIQHDIPLPKTLRQIVLERLSEAGSEGSKAAAIREFYERSFGKTIHEKTVGMTLYRLQGEGLVRREGHIWFSVPSKAETENPGGETPGPINSEIT